MDREKVKFGYVRGTYVKTICPYCKNANLVVVGDVEEVFESEVDACKCFSCQRKFWIDNSCLSICLEMQDINTAQDIDCVRCEDGIKID